MEDFFKEKDFYELLSEASNNNSIITVDHIDISDKEFEKVVAMYDYAWSLAYGKDLFDGEEYIGTTNDPEATQKAYQIICDIYDRIKELEPSIKQSSNINWSGTKETYLLRIFDYYHKVVEPVRDLIKESKPHAKVKAIEEDKVDMIICTGGMSVDPDDVTPSAIKDCNGEIVTYGAPVLPGAMFLLAYYKNIPILGVPSCAMYSKRTIFDLVLPRILADEKLSFEDIARFGNGGMCLNCEICSFPHCSFGK